MNSYNIICPYFLKKAIMSSLQPSDHVKFYTMEQVTDFLLPKISGKAIQYIYYNFANRNLSYALTLANSVKYVCQEVHYSKTEQLLTIYRALKSEKLFELDEMSIRLLKNRPLKIIGYSSCPGFIRLLKDNKIEYKIESADQFVSNLRCEVSTFQNKREELIEMVNRVGELLYRGVSYGDIGVISAAEDMPLIHLIGEQSNIQFSYSDIDLTLNLLVPQCLDLIAKHKEKEFVDLLKISSNERDNTIKRHIFDIYLELKDQQLTDDFFLAYFKYLLTNKKITSTKGIKLVSNYEKVADLKYVFLVNFNDSYPRIFKNSDFLIDKVKKDDTYMEQSVDLNQRERDKLILALSNISNLYMSVAENDEVKGKIFPSRLIDGEKLIKKEYVYQGGDRFTYNFDQLDYAILNNEYIDYGVSSEYYFFLSDVFKNSYVKYRPNDEQITCKFDTSKLRFSYSSMTTYAKCPFRYLIEKVYRINDSPFVQIYLDIGTFCHYYLEKYVNEERLSFDETFQVLNRKYDDYSIQEKFYLHRAYDEVKDFASYLMDFLDSLGGQKKVLTEQKFNVKLQDKYDITGIVDLLVEDIEGFLVFDYKTGNHKLDINDVINGFDMQLPFYTYVVQKELLPDKKPYGMYYITLLQPDSISKYFDSFKFNGLMIDDGFLKRASDFDVIKKYISVSSRSKIKIDYAEMNERMLKRIDEIISGVKSFSFPVTKKIYVNADGSRRNSQCENCNYRDVCFVEDNSKQVVEIAKIQDKSEAEEE